MQPEPTGSGNAVLHARAAIGDEPFAVMLPDDIFDNANEPCLRRMLDASRRVNAPVVALKEVSPCDVRKFGMVEWLRSLRRGDACTDSPAWSKNLTNSSEARSKFGIVGRYVLTSEIFGLLAESRPGANGKYQLTDGLLAP